MVFKNVLIISAVVALGICSWFLINSGSPTIIEECDNVFTSQVYPEFQTQLTAFLARESLPEIPLNPKESFRDYHTSLITRLRTNPNKLNRLSHWLMTSPELLKPMQEFLFAKFPLPDYRENYGNVIREFHKTISEDTSFTSYKSPDFDDAVLFGNLPSYLFSTGKTKVIRMANPVKDQLLIHTLFTYPKETVNKEFYQYTSTLDQKHLYVNLMKRYGNEWRKTKQLEKFSTTQPFLILVSLDKDSSFYWQRKNFASMNDAKEFKRMFHQRLFQSNGNYYWSDKLDKEAWAKECLGILEKVHEDYFFSKPQLAREEREDFIELCYLGIINRLIEIFEPGVLNISCRQSMDRGPSLTTLLYTEHLLAQGMDLSLYHPQILTMIFSPPLLIHNRKSHTSRIERFASVMERLQEANGRCDHALKS